MNTYLFASVENMWLLAGWTMIHFLWLGALVALAALVSRWLLRRASANVRYVVALTYLATLAAMPIAIATWLHEYSPSVQVADQPLRNGAANQVIELKNIEPKPLATPPAIAMGDMPMAVQPEQQAAQPSKTTIAVPTPAIAAPSAADPLSLAISAINRSVQYLPWLWLIGTPITFAFTATGLIGTRRLRRASRPITDGPIAETLAQLVASLHLTRRVVVAVCDRIAAPVLIGILRPIILLPPAALTGYSPEEIEMVLLHELAHVRRWDNLVNLVQRLIESLLFFHPAVWLISSWARRERETCCDALVVARTDHPHAYAELLVALAAQMPRSVLFHPAASSAMAAGPLRSRIRRILKLDDDPMLISGKSFTLMLAALLVAITLAVLYLPSIGQAEQADAKERQNPDVATPEKKNVLDKEKTERLESRDKLQKELQELQGEIKRKYQDSLAIAKGLSSTTGSHDPENDLLIRDIANAQKQTEDLTSAYFRLQTDYMVAKRELSDPKLLETPAEEALKLDLQYADLLEKAKAQAGPSDGSEYEAVEKYRADFKKKAVREMQNKPNIPLQQLTQRYKTNSESMQKQIAFLTQNLERKKKELEQRAGKSADLQQRGEELKKLQQIANAINAAMKQPDNSVEAEPLAFELKPDSSGQTEILLNGSHTTEEAIRKLLRERAASNTDQAISLSADKSINYAEVMRIVDLFESLGIKKLALDTRFVQATDATVTAAAGAAQKQNATPRAVEPQVIATLPADWGNPSAAGYQQVVKTIREVHEKHLRPDVIQRDGKVLLVATPQPTEKDWPAMLGESPRKERVIAEKAWQQLGLKLAPLNVAEEMYRMAYTGNQQSSALWIIGGNVPKGLPLPSILVKLDSDTNSVLSMDTLLNWLGNDEGQRQGVKCYAMADDKEYLFESQPPADTVSTNAIQPAPDLTHSTPTRHHFPSLEDQKLADLAWKKLGLELEPIGDEDLKRVKALGYNGGVIVTSVSAVYYNGVEPDDILVGLHVWPTTNMKAVAEILNRDDLEQLEPLKFYAIRLKMSPNDNNNFQDAVVSGRISVQKSPPSQRSINPTAPPTPTSSNSAPSAFPDAPLVVGPPAEASPYAVPSGRSSREPTPAPVPYIPKVTLGNRPYADASPLSPTPPPLPAIAPAMPSSPPPTAASATIELRPEFLKRTFADSSSSQEHSSIVTETPSTTPVPNSPALKSVLVAPKDGTTLTPSSSSRSNRVGSTVVVPNVEQVKIADHYPASLIANHDPKPDEKPAPTTRVRERNWRQKSQSNQVIVAYEIPKDLVRDVPRFGNRGDLRTTWDEHGRYIVQADQEWHDRFKRLLEDAPKWRDPAARLERAQHPIVMTQKDGESRLEWRGTGLTFKDDPNPEPAQHRGFNGPGVVVADVAPGSPANWDDIRIGDQIAEAGRFRATSVSELNSLFKTMEEGFQNTTRLPIKFERYSETHGYQGFQADYTLRPDDPDPNGPEVHKEKPTASGTGPGAAPEKPTTQLPGNSPPKQLATSKPDLRYDGKSFGQWQNAWQTELSTDKRIEAVKALAAFGRAGYGKEAAIAILDVAGEYDFNTIESDGEGKLKEAVLDQLAPDSRPQAMAKYWVPILAERLKTDPNKWQELTIQLLFHLRANDEATSSNLYSFAKAGPDEVRAAALGALVASSKARNGGPKIDGKSRELLVDALQSKDPSTIAGAIRLVLYYPPNMGGGLVQPPKLIFQKELVPLLFHPNEEIRQQTRGVLRYISKEDAPPVIKQLVAIIQDKSRQQDHIHAIRGLAAIGGSATDAISELSRLRTSSQDKNILVATLVAVGRIKDGDLRNTATDGGVFPSMIDGLSEEEKNDLSKRVGKLDSKECWDSIMRENDLLLPPESKNSGGGGGGFF